MTWQKMDKYYLKNGDYTICKIKIGEKMTYELWHTKTGVIQQGLMTAMQAIEQFERLSE